MTDNSTPWIVKEMNQASKDWNDQPEWTKPLISASYFASRGKVSNVNHSGDKSD